MMHQCINRVQKTTVITDPNYSFIKMSCCVYVAPPIKTLLHESNPKRKKKPGDFSIPGPGGEEEEEEEEEEGEGRKIKIDSIVKNGGMLSVRSSSLL